MARSWLKFGSVPKPSLLKEHGLVEDSKTMAPPDFQFSREQLIDCPSRISRRAFMMSSTDFHQEIDRELHYLLEFGPSSAEVNWSSVVSFA
ncbi:MAG TPA: hypothetical protein VGM98_06035 [Schlesneria sp.]